MHPSDCQNSLAITLRILSYWWIKFLFFCNIIIKLQNVSIMPLAVFFTKIIYCSEACADNLQMWDKKKKKNILSREGLDSSWIAIMVPVCQVTYMNMMFFKTITNQKIKLMCLLPVASWFKSAAISGCKIILVF